MKEKEKSLWDYAGKAGLALGAIPILYMLIEQLWLQDAADTLGAFPASLITFVLWLAKFVGCILLMRYFMRNYTFQSDGITHRDARLCGIAIALTSALIYSAFVLAWSKFIDPEMFARAFDTVAEQYASFMDSNTQAAMEQLKDSMPVIAFFSNFIWCFLYGSILSVILARNIGSDDTPFDIPSNPDKDA